MEVVAYLSLRIHVNPCRHGRGNLTQQRGSAKRSSKSDVMLFLSRGNGACFTLC